MTLDYDGRDTILREEFEPGSHQLKDMDGRTLHPGHSEGGVGRTGKVPVVAPARKHLCGELADGDGHRIFPSDTNRAAYNCCHSKTEPIAHRMQALTRRQSPDCPTTSAIIWFCRTLAATMYRMPLCKCSCTV